MKKNKSLKEFIEKMKKMNEEHDCKLKYKGYCDVCQKIYEKQRH